MHDEVLRADESRQRVLTQDQRLQFSGGIVATWMNPDRPGGRRIFRVAKDRPALIRVPVLAASETPGSL